MADVDVDEVAEVDELDVAEVDVDVVSEVDVDEVSEVDELDVADVDVDVVSEVDVDEVAEVLDDEASKSHARLFPPSIFDTSIASITNVLLELSESVTST